MKLATVEAEMNGKLIDKLANELNESNRNMRFVKNVLRIPRLYNEYRKILCEVSNEQQLKIHLASRVFTDSDDYDKEGKQCISTALKMTF